MAGSDTNDGIEIHEYIRKDPMEDFGNDDGCRLAGSRCRSSRSQDKGQLQTPVHALTGNELTPSTVLESVP